MKARLLGVLIVLTASANSAPSAGPAPSADDHDVTTHLVFGSADTKKEHSDEFYNGAFRKEGESSGRSEELKPGQWEEEDLSRVFPDLRVLDTLSSRESLKKLQRVLRHYNHANSRLRAAQSTIQSKRVEWEGEQHRYPWMAIERKKQQEQQAARIEAHYRSQAIGDLVRAMQTMESIRSPEVVRSEQFVDLKAKVFVQYVKLQFRARNLGLCIPVLEQYLALKPQHANDPEPHRLLAASYRHQQLVAQRMRNGEAEHQYRTRKNKHLEQFIVLKYGKESPQYAEMKARIDRDSQANIR